MHKVSEAEELDSNHPEAIFDFLNDCLFPASSFWLIT